MTGKTSPQVGINGRGVATALGRVERLGRWGRAFWHVGPRLPGVPAGRSSSRRESPASDSAEYVPRVWYAFNRSVTGAHRPLADPRRAVPVHERRQRGLAPATVGARDAGYHAHRCYPGKTRTLWGVGWGFRRASAASSRHGRGFGRRRRCRAARPQPRIAATPWSMTTPGRCSSGGRPADSGSLKPGPVKDPPGSRNSA